MSYREISKDNVVAVLEQSDLVHLTISNFTSETEGKINGKIWFIPININVKEKIDTSIDMRFKVGTKKVDGKRVFTATITEIKTSTDLTVIFGEKIMSMASDIPKNIKKEVDKFLDILFKKALQKIMDKTIEKLS